MSNYAFGFLAGMEAVREMTVTAGLAFLDGAQGVHKRHASSGTAASAWRAGARWAASSRGEDTYATPEFAKGYIAAIGDARMGEFHGEYTAAELVEASARHAENEARIARALAGK